MCVEQSQPLSDKPLEGAQPADEPAGVEGGSSTGQQPDQVALSRLSQAVSGELERDVCVEELRGRVAEGAYQVPAADLSQRLVDALLRKGD